MLLFLDFIYFLILVFFIFYLPGRFLLSIISPHVSDAYVIVVAKSLAVGMCAFILGTYILSYFHIELLYNVYIVCSDIWISRQAWQEIVRARKHWKSVRVHVCLLFVGVIITTLLTWMSGDLSVDPVTFEGINGTDGIFHISLISTLQYIFPPQHPGLAHIQLHGYNFFYDFLLAKLAGFYHFSPTDLYFRYASFLTAVMYGFGAWALAKKLGWREQTINILLFIIFWTQDFSYLITTFSHWIYNPGVVQTISNIFDPSVLLSFSFICIGYTFLFSEHKSEKWLLILILAVLPMLKIYTAVLFFFACIIVSLIEIIHKKRMYDFFIVGVGSTFAAGFYIPVNFGSGQLIFAPGLFYTHFLQSISADNNLQIWDKIIIYQQHNNSIHIWYYYVLFLLIYFLPTLGIRLILFAKIKILLQKKFYTQKNIFWINMIVLGFLLPSLFIQSVAVFVIVQFFWIAYLVLLIPTAYIIGQFYLASSKGVQYAIVIVLLLLSLPQTFFLVLSYQQTNPSVLPRKFVAATQAIQKIIPAQESYVAYDVAPSNMMLFPITSAMIQRQTFYEPEWLEFAHTSNLIQERQNEVALLKSDIIQCDSTKYAGNVIRDMHDMQSRYLFTLSEHTCLRDNQGILQMYKNAGYGLYMIK